MSIVAKPIHVQLQPFFEARNNFYQFLHLLFSEPISGRLMMLGETADFHGLEEIHEGGRILKLFFANLTPEILAQLQEEYQRLFIGPGPILVPPWESYYRSKERLLFDECTYQIRQEYHRFGLQAKFENNEPDDHLLLELEFMLFLIEKTTQESQTAGLFDLISSQIHFLEGHLSVWIPLFCKLLKRQAKSDLYTGAAMLLEDFISFDLQSLLELKERLEYAG